jgi:methyltransferase (TIGR00027 family)
MAGVLERKASQSALALALMRAVHDRCGDPLFRDPVAEKLLTPRERSGIIAVLWATLGHPGEPPGGDSIALYRALAASPAFGSIIVRARYAEECLELAMASHVRQYVLIGAGLDTFAFRRTNLARELRIFELDHRASQADKRARLARAGLSPAPHLVFVPVDLETHSVGEALAGSGFDAGAPAFFSWLGVTRYLSRAAIRATLASIAGVASAGSTLVFNYTDTDGRAEEDRGSIERRMDASVEAAGERVRTTFRPLEIARELGELGYQVLEDLDAGALRERYLRDRRDLRLRAAVRICLAAVSGRSGIQARQSD